MFWRPMTPADLPAVTAIAERVHPAYPEDAAVFAERLALYPAGCRVLAGEGALIGYVLSHPWRFGAPPRLNSLLGEIPARADSYYIHDLALLPEARGARAASEIVAQLVAKASQDGFARLSLIAVNDSAAFWRRHGFAPVDDPALKQKLRSYDEGAVYMARRTSPQ